jgi:hypothetical protein
MYAQRFCCIIQFMAASFDTTYRAKMSKLSEHWRESIIFSLAFPSRKVPEHWLDFPEFERRELYKRFMDENEVRRSLAIKAKVNMTSIFTPSVDNEQRTEYIPSLQRLSFTLRAGEKSFLAAGEKELMSYVHPRDCAWPQGIALDPTTPSETIAFISLVVVPVRGRIPASGLVADMIICPAMA